MQPGGLPLRMQPPPATGGIPAAGPSQQSDSSKYLAAVRCSFPLRHRPVPVLAPRGNIHEARTSGLDRSAGTRPHLPRTRVIYTVQRERLLRLWDEKDRGVNVLWRVTSETRERVSREFDDRGPETCVAEVVEDLRLRNPELLDMAIKCATSLGDYKRIMQGFGMFYRLILGSAIPDRRGTALNPLPRVAPETRDWIVEQIDRKGPNAFTRETIQDLERSNPELLQMAHNFASGQPDYLAVMQGFALIYKSLAYQSILDLRRLH